MDNSPDSDISILKTLWTRESDSRWGISGIKGLTLKPQAGFDSRFFKFESQMELMTTSPRGNIHSVLASFGPTNFLLEQSILPVVAWVERENLIKCIGTASVISCSGYLMTACHVLLDPQDREYGDVIRQGNTLVFGEGLNMGVFIPYSPAYGSHGFRFLSFEKCWYWGEWKKSPLFNESDRFVYLTDIAICKVSELPDGVPHQPLNLSLNPFKKGENAYALGYALMEDIPFCIKDGQPVINKFVKDLYVSVGEIMEVFPENHVRKDVPTPGPCFDFKARIPGKMSGGPIFGAQGAVVRGVVSRSFSAEPHGYGAMLGPTMHLPLEEGTTLKILMESGNEGIAEIQGMDL